MISTVLAFLSAAATKVFDPVAEVQSQIDDLKRNYNEHLALITKQRDDWQTMALNWRERCHALESHVSKERRRSDLSLVNSLNHALRAQRDPFTPINEALENFCNCVPSRDQVFRAERIRAECERPFVSSPENRTD